MEKKKKIIILSSIILGVLVLTLGIAYALFSYQQTGNNTSQLIMGDIYMHYKENNQLILNNAMPQEGFKTLLTGYKVNPIMAIQDASDTTTELYACINLFQNEWGWGLDEGEDFESFCKGTGTNWGWTLQMYLDNDFGEYEYSELLSLNIIEEETLEYTNIKLNPEMKNQTVEYENELTACVNFFQEWTFDEGSTTETFCQGTGTYSDGDVTFQNDLDSWMVDDRYYFEFLSSNNIIIEDGESYIVNPVMANQMVGEINELMTCVRLFMGFNFEFDEGTTAESFCKGEGTYDGGMTLKGEFEEAKDNIDYMNFVGRKLLENNIILTEFEDDLPYFEFTISGKNTYSEKDINYEIILSHGDNHETRTERIRDDLLRFRLVEIKDNKETVVISNATYEDLTEKRIYVNTIPKNTLQEIEFTYRLYMWISSDTVIGGGDIDYDYDMDTWNNQVYGSIKVNVKGDFSEKLIYTDENCFNAVKRLGDFTLNTSEEAVNKCITYIESKQTNGEFSSENAIENYCRGIGTRKNYYNIYHTGDFTIREDLLYDTKNATNAMTPYFMPDDIQYFIDEHIIENVEYVAQIISYDNNCGSEVIIPKEIAGYPVTILGHNSGFMEKIFLERLTDNLVVNSGFYLPYFLGDGKFSKVVIPNTIKEVVSTIFVDAEIENLEFEENFQIESFGYINRGLFFGNAYLFNGVTINNFRLPDSVTKLSERAIASSNIGKLDLNNVETIELASLDNYNVIEEIIIGSNIKYIGETFSYSEIGKLTIDKTCDEIENIQVSETDTTLHYPWGLDVYGSGGEVCETK